MQGNSGLTDLGKRVALEARFLEEPLVPAPSRRSHQPREADQVDGICTELCRPNAWKVLVNKLSSPTKYDYAGKEWEAALSTTGTCSSLGLSHRSSHLVFRAQLAYEVLWARSR